MAATGGSAEGKAAFSMRPAFAEMRLPERPAPMPEIELRRGEVSVFFRGGCDEALLRKALSLLGGAPC